MSQQAGVPADLKEQIRNMIRQEVAETFRSAPLRNASISGGKGLTVRGEGGITIDGGRLRVTGLPGVEPGATGASTVYMGGITPAMPDGTLQPGIIFRREDGTIALALYDPTPSADSPGGFQQFLALFDREQNIVLSDDTYSGQGLARPYVPTVLHRARYADWVTTTSTSFETLFHGVLNKQHPNLLLQLQASNDTAGATGEVRVLVNDVPWGAAQATEFLIRTRTFGSAPVDGEHMESLVVKVQARVASGTGGVRVEPVYLMGRQS